ncbi:MAG: glycosyltransferase family 4 protein [Acidimicrobiales bacterium]
MANREGIRATVIVADQLHQRVLGGIGTYTKNVLERLCAGAPEAASGEFVLFASAPSKRVDRRSPLEQIRSTQELRFARTPQPLAQRLWDHGLDGPPFPWKTMHSMSMGGPKPRRLRADQDLSFTVFDTAWITQPESFPAHGRKWHEATFNFIKATATMVVTASEFASDAIVSAGLDRARIRVIPPGSDHLPPADHGRAQELLRALGVRSEYVLTVSTLEPRKNLPMLVDSFRELRTTLTDPYDLVIVGPKGWGDDLEEAPGIKLAGFVEPAVLAGLYSGARAFVYVPLEEGFGLPVLEAFSQCIPVVASKIPASVVGALHVDPRDRDSIVEGLHRVLSDDPLRSSLVTGGLQVAQEHSWDRAAEAHAQLLKELAR